MTGRCALVRREVIVKLTMGDLPNERGPCPRADVGPWRATLAATLCALCVMALAASDAHAQAGAAVVMPRSEAQAKPAASGRLLMTALMSAPAMCAFTMACILLPRPEIKITTFLFIALLSYRFQAACKFIKLLIIADSERKRKNGF